MIFNSIIQSSFADLKIFWALRIHPSPTQTLETPNLFTVSIVLFFPRMAYSRNQRVCIAFSDWLPLFSDKHLRFLQVFSWLESSFFFFSFNHGNNILLYGCTIVYLSIRLVKDMSHCFNCCLFLHETMGHSLF